MQSDIYGCMVLFHSTNCIFDSFQFPFGNSKTEEIFMHIEDVVLEGLVWGDVIVKDCTKDFILCFFNIHLLAHHFHDVTKIQTLFPCILQMLG